MNEQLQNILKNQQNVYKKIENTYATKDELSNCATKDKVSKPWVFNTKKDLSAWLYPNICPIPQCGTKEEPVTADKGYTYTITPDDNGYFAFELIALNGATGASNMPLLTLTLEPGLYIVSRNRYIIFDAPGSLYLGINSPLSGVFRVKSDSAPITITLSSRCLLENYSDGKSYVPDLYLKIASVSVNEVNEIAAEFTPYNSPFIHDGGTKEDLKTGDLLLVQEKNTLDYYWDGNTILPFTNTGHTHSAGKGIKLQDSEDGGIEGTVKLDLNLAFELVNNTIKLYDKSDSTKTAIASLDASNFIKDGFLKNVELKESDGSHSAENGPYLVFTWNIDNAIGTDTDTSMDVLWVSVKDLIPTLATVATTGDYNDLSNKPTVITRDDLDGLWSDTDDVITNLNNLDPGLPIGTIYVE